jgi:lipoprotein-releasing system ATP-binding protein
VSKALISLTSVAKTYGTAALTYALRDVTLEVGRGEFTAILGPSGSGKSTLLNLLGALDRPSAGVVRIGGESLTDLDPDGLALLRQKHLGFVFQFHHLLPDFSALDNVLMPIWAKKGSADDAEVMEAKDLLERVGLGAFLNRKPGQLSGGQQQRVAIARALVGKRSIVLADEPTGNLDTQNSKEAFQLMREFNQREGITFLIITHDTRLARLTDRIIEIVDGRVRYDGPTQNYQEPRELP